MINIYLDTSGSMTEMGKDSALLYIAKSIEDYYNFKSIETLFFKLNGEMINELTNIEYLNDIKLETQSIKENSILLSDGLFNVDAGHIFNISISIGIDSDIINLKKISNKVFSNDELLAALEYLLFQNSLLDSFPVVEEEGDDDEW
ncbi:hypothetical protein JHD48_10260 [Sulfurimonas sp. SAG-AH-194-I05]|nr:hypothetical protein [Sulfurimonas sp. SAG-AH-194-I05]MDF1876115.1 hypothetical protein [Sulfurimonas sp. SAG-AH-194-I05]